MTTTETPVQSATEEAKVVIAIALDVAAWGSENVPDTSPDGPLPSSEALDDAEVALQALLDRPDLLEALSAQSGAA